MSHGNLLVEGKVLKALSGDEKPKILYRPKECGSP